MTSGFQKSTDETKIEIVVRRLTPAAKRVDIHAFADGVREAQSRYGKAIADEAMMRVLEQNRELSRKAIEFLPDEMKPHLQDAAYSIVAEQLEDAGLRLEDHFRVSDQGMALTREAVKEIAKTGFPYMHEFGEGNESLEDVGLNRTDGFWHPLSEMDEDSDSMNLWAFASILISVAQNWTEGNQANSLNALQEAVSIVAPTLDLTAMLRQSRYDDRALLKLCSYAEQGLQLKCDKAFNR